MHPRVSDPRAEQQTEKAESDARNGRNADNLNHRGIPPRASRFCWSKLKSRACFRACRARRSLRQPAPFPMKTLGVAIVGCGGITLQNHLPGLAMCAETKVVALCDTNPATLEQARRETGIAVTSA